MSRAAFLATVLTICSLSAATGHAFRQRAASSTQSPLVYSHSNGGPGFSSSERITLRPDGTVVFETSGPIAFDWTTQNRVGEFQAQVGAATYTALADAFNRALPAGPRLTIYPPDSGIEGISLGKGDGTYLAKLAGDPSPIFDALASRFVPLAAAARQRPIRALQLSCTKGTGALACLVRSVGAAPVPAPTFTNGRYWCFDRQRRMLPLSPPVVEGGAQRDLAPGESIDLRLAGAACEFHVVIEISSGVLVSGELAQ